MNIADKSTLDVINNLISNIGNYIGYRNTAISMRYYLPKGTKITCDRSLVSVYQHNGDVALIDEGYKMSEDSLVTVSSVNGSSVEELVYNISQSLID